MTVIKALILGIIAGITDFLPVSATGHVTLFANIMGVEGDIDLIFMIAIHIGTLISVFLVFYKPILRVLYEFFGLIGDIIANTKLKFSHTRNKEKKHRRLIKNKYRKLAALVCVAMIPSIIIGFFVASLSETLIGNLLGSGIGLFVTALLLLVSSFSGELTRGPKEAKYTDAIFIGAFQGFAGFPGVSRLGMTTSSAFLSGFAPKFALMVSFVLSIPTVLGAFVFEAIRANGVVSNAGLLPTFIAMIAAAIVGYVALRFLKNLIQPAFARIFAIYTCVVGIISVIIYLV